MVVAGAVVGGCDDVFRITIIPTANGRTSLRAVCKIPGHGSDEGPCRCWLTNSDYEDCPGMLQMSRLKDLIEWGASGVGCGRTSHMVSSTELRIKRGVVVPKAERLRAEKAGAA